MNLNDLLSQTDEASGQNSAIIEAASGLRLDYSGLQQLSDALRDRLAAFDVGRGARVGLYLRKSVDAVAAILGVLKSGAAYVPADPSAPASRAAFIHSDCDVSVVIIEARFLEAFRREWSAHGRPEPRAIVLPTVGAGAGLDQALKDLSANSPAAPVATASPDADDLAYILYTSGSTGQPKGVMLSHRNATAFVEWCSRILVPTAKDVFSSHAPFHFDLSILDLFVPLRHRSSLVVIGEGDAKDAATLTSIVEQHRVSVWYSTPSVLRVMTEFGRIDERDWSNLRLILFAGEVFPLTHFRALRAKAPAPRYLNLYGPTETNVCTWYEVPPALAEDQTDAFPIGPVCDQLAGRVVNPEGADLIPGQPGELCISGPNVMQGYWGRPEQTEAAFIADADGRRWYKTGDVVVEDEAGSYRYLGRKDRMIKRRGYRVELGEIEACLHRHPSVREAAVVAVPDDAGNLMVKAHLAVVSGTKLSLIELKTYCSGQLPLYMIPDRFVLCEALPKTSTDKIDYQALAAQGDRQER